MCQEGMVAGVVIPYLTQSRWDFVGGIFFFAFCHIQWVGDIPVVRDTSVFCHLQVIVVEYEMHVIFVSPVAGEQATVEKGCGLILVKPPAIQVIYVESKPQSFVCIDGKIGFEAFFSVTAASSL